MVHLKAIVFLAVALEVSSVAEGFAYSPGSSSIKSRLFKLKSRAAKIPASHYRKLQRSAHHEKQLRKQDLLLDVATTFKKVAGFIAREAEKANDDLLFSLRITQGQLAQLRTEAPGLWEDRATAPLLESAQQDLSSAADVLMRTFMAETLSEEFSFMMDRGLWDNLRRLDASSSIENFENILAEVDALHQAEDEEELQFTEDVSDECLSQLQLKQNSLEVTEATGRNSSCAISRGCWRMMTRPGAQKYYLTHQLLFLMMGWSAGCAPDLERLAQEDFEDKLPRTTTTDVVPELMRHQCSRVLEEARTIAAAWYPDNDKDLFLEQGMLCGAAVRMPEFFEPFMIRSAISWQKSSGCFGFVDLDAYLNSFRSDQKAAFALDRRLDDFSNGVAKTNSRDGMRSSQGQKESLYDHLEEDDGQQRVRLITGHSEKKSPAPTARREKIMSRSCMSHNTAVAMGYFGVAMRYLAAE